MNWFGKWLNPKEDAAVVQDAFADAIVTTISAPEPIPASIQAALIKATSEASRRLGDLKVTVNRIDGAYVFSVEDTDESLSLVANLVDAGYYSTPDLADLIVAWRS